MDRYELIPSHRETKDIFGFLDLENLRSNLIKNCYVLKTAFALGKTQPRKFCETNYRILLFLSEKGSFSKLMTIYKV